MAAFEEAYGLYAGPASFTRRELEARLLAGELFEQVAVKCGASLEAIEAYQSLFFNVADRLGATDYIATTAIGRKLHTGLTAGDVDALLKVFAYGGGPLVLDQAVAYFKGPSALPERLDGRDADALAELGSQLRIRRSSLALTTPARSTAVSKLAALQNDLQGGVGPGAQEASISGLLQQPIQAEVDLAWMPADRPEAALGAAAVPDGAEAEAEGASRRVA
jgi:hypothetical protein